jgi:transposase
MPPGDPTQTGADLSTPVWKETTAMAMVADITDAVVGVDTHRDTHSLQISTSGGVPIAQCTVGNDDAGFAAAITWAVRHAPGPRLLFAVEGTRSYGIGLTRAVQAAGHPVVEIVRSARDNRRRGNGKTDAIDAQLAVMTALPLDSDHLPTPRADGDREALRILLDARDEMTVTRTRQVNRLRALLLSGDDNDRPLARGALTVARLRAIARRRGLRGDSRQEHVRRAETRGLASAIRDADAQLSANARRLTEIVTEIAPDLLQRHGVGPVSGAQAIVAFSHPGRCRSEAAYASLAGACPIPASSGQTSRWRLNRGGDRALNRAVHAIAHARMISCSRSRDYVTRRRADGKSTPEIRRCLKR